MLARSRKSSPILRMITEGKLHENGRPPARKSMQSGKRRTVRDADRPLWGRPIFPVVLIISGYSFVSSIVAEIKSSNFQNGDIRWRGERPAKAEEGSANKRNLYGLREGMG